MNNLNEGIVDLISDIVDVHILKFNVKIIESRVVDNFPQI